MGSEFGMPQEWNHESELPWGLLQIPEHSAVLDWVAALNDLYRNEPALHRCDASADGFRWVVGNDDANSVIAFLRLATGHRPVLVVCNFTAVPRNGYRIGVPVAGRWTTLLNSDDNRFGGGGIGTALAETEAVAAHGHDAIAADRRAAAGGVLPRAGLNDRSSRSDQLRCATIRA